MTLPPPPEKWDPQWMARFVQELESELSMLIRRDGTLEIGGRAIRLEGTDMTTGQRYLLNMDGGVWTSTPL